MTSGGRRSSPSRRPRASAGQGRLVGGLHPVRELLRSRQQVTSVLVARSDDTGPVLDEIIRLAAARSVPVERHERARVDALVPGLVHQGVVARAPAFPFQGLGNVLERLSATGEAPLLVALDGVTDPQNLGSIARTAEAVGAHGLLVPRRRAAGITPAVEKAAAGALAHLPVIAVTNLVRTLAELHEAGVWSLGLDGDAPTELADHALVAEPCVLVVGSEGAGLARLTRARCDALVRLPMRGRIASLNASVAAGVALYTLMAGRSAVQSRGRDSNP